jgi:hypothetical protein
MLRTGLLVVASTTSAWAATPYTWAASSPAPIEAKGAAVACAFDLCYYIGGSILDPNNPTDPTAYTATNAVATFNVTSGVWDTDLPSLTKIRSYAQAAVVFDDPVNNPTHYIVYVFGGQDDADDSYTFQAMQTTEYFDIDVGAWQVLDSALMPGCYNPSYERQCNWVPAGGVSKTASAVINTTIFVFGGSYFNGDGNGGVGVTMCSFVLETASPAPQWEILNGIHGERLV